MTGRWMVAVALCSSVVVGCGDDSGDGLFGVDEQQIEEQIENEIGGQAQVEIGEDGSFTIETDEGELSFDADGEGNFTLESDEGSGEVIGGPGAEIPDELPIELPAGGTSSSVFDGTDGGTRTISVVVEYPASAFDELVAAIGSQLERQEGYSEFSTDDGVTPSASFLTETASAVITVDDQVAYLTIVAIHPSSPVRTATTPACDGA